MDWQLPDRKKLGTKEEIFAKLEENKTSLNKLKKLVKDKIIPSQTYLRDVINETFKKEGFVKPNKQPYQINAVQLEEFIEKHNIDLPKKLTAPKKSK